jgi:hypothetical protein
MSGSNSSPPAASALDEPLQLTVHSLPGQRTDDRTRRVSGRLKMLVVALVCAAPVVASYITYYVVRPETRRSFGELIEPQRPIPPINARTLEGKTVALPALQGQWLLVSVASGACDVRCENYLYLQRQLRESLGKDKDRLDWVWLVNDDVPVRPELRAAVAPATVLRVDATQLAQWLQPVQGHAADEHLYVVDPLGHWMMRFPAGVDRSSANKVKRDLDRLMRASVSWDRAGR